MSDGGDGDCWGGEVEKMVWYYMWPIKVKQVKKETTSGAM